MNIRKILWVASLLAMVAGFFVPIHYAALYMLSTFMVYIIMGYWSNATTSAVAGWGLIAVTISGLRLGGTAWIVSMGLWMFLGILILTVFKKHFDKPF